VLMNEIAVAGSYAIVGFTNTNADVTALLVNSNGTWQEIEEGGGQIVMESILLRVPTTPTAMAQGLETFAESQAGGN